MTGYRRGRKVKHLRLYIGSGVTVCRKCRKVLTPKVVKMTCKASRYTTRRRD